MFNLGAANAGRRLGGTSSSVPGRRTIIIQYVDYRYKVDLVFSLDKFDPPVINISIH